MTPHNATVDGRKFASVSHTGCPRQRSSGHSARPRPRISMLWCVTGVGFERKKTLQVGTGANEDSNIDIGGRGGAFGLVTFQTGCFVFGLVCFQVADFFPPTVLTTHCCLLCDVGIARCQSPFVIAATLFEPLGCSSPSRPFRPQLCCRCPACLALRSCLPGCPRRRGTCCGA